MNARGVVVVVVFVVTSKAFICFHFNSLDVKLLQADDIIITIATPSQEPGCMTSAGLPALSSRLSLSLSRLTSSRSLRSSDLLLVGPQKYTLSPSTALGALETPSQPITALDSEHPACPLDHPAPCTQKDACHELFPCSQRDTVFTLIKC